MPGSMTTRPARERRPQLNVHQTVRMSRDDVDALEAIAIANDRKLGTEIRRAVREYIDRHQEARP